VSNDLWTLVRFLHVTAAILWVGGQLTLSLLVRPVAGRLFDEDTRRLLISALGGAFGRLAALGLIPVLLATGLSLIYHRGVTLGYLGTAGYGATLTAKIVLALVSFVLAAVHGMTAARAATATARWVGVAGSAVSVAVVALAVRLVP
jgi:uncharacterized membrane protein